MASLRGFKRLFSCFINSSSTIRLKHTPSTARLLLNHTPDRLISSKASSSSTARLLKFTLRDFKQDPSYYVGNYFVTNVATDPRKYFAMQVIEDICVKIKSGIQGGSLALDDITVTDIRVRLPEAKIHNPYKHKNYIEGYKDFFYELYGGFDEPVDNAKYMDVKSYVKALKTVDQLYLLRHHPYFQLEDQATRFIPFAVQVLDRVQGKFPDPESMHQPKFDIYKGDWYRIYKDLRDERDGVNISDSIDSLASQDHKIIFRSIYNAGKSEKSGKSSHNPNPVPYNDTEAVDELVFLKKMCTRQPNRRQSSIKFRNDDDKFQALSQPSQIVSLVIYELLWKYAGCHNGPIDMNIFRQSHPY